MKTANTCSDLFDGIIRDQGLKNDARLAEYLGCKHSRISQLRTSNQKLTARQVLSFMKTREKVLEAELLKNLVRPIVEYYPITIGSSKQGKNSEILPTSDGFPRNRKIQEALQAITGIYVFYDSMGAALYVGKTERQNLWKEMKDAFNLERSNHTTSLVSHPGKGQRFEPAYEKPRQPKKVKVRLCDTAHYFSAYQVYSGAVGKVEALLVRAFCNSLSNKKMEKLD